MHEIFIPVAGPRKRVAVYQYLMIVVIAALFLAGPAQAKKAKVIETKVDLYERFGPPIISGPAGYVVIDAVTINRTQPPNSGDPVTVSPDYRETQIGWYKKHRIDRYGFPTYREYLILLEGTNIKRFVQQAITLGFNRAGYAVVATDDPRAASAARVEIELTSLWMWVVPLDEDWVSSQFHFYIKTAVTSDTPELANIGTVKGSGFRN